MKTSQLSELSDEELAAAYKKTKLSRVMRAVLIGVMIGASLYGYTKNGFSIFTIMPLIFIGLFAKSNKELTALEAEVKSRTKNQQNGIL